MRNYDEEIKHTVFTSGYYRRRNSGSDRSDAVRMDYNRTKDKTVRKEIAAYCHTQKAVCMNSATACLEMTLRLFGIGEGDEVIVPAYTYTASASVVCHVGATLKLVDCAPGSFHLDYDALEQAVTEKTKAIIPVDIAGVMVDYDRIRALAERKKHCFTRHRRYRKHWDAF